MRKFHDEEGHFCANTVLGKLRAAKLYWPTMALDVARYVRSCAVSQATRRGHGEVAPDELTSTAERPWQVLSMDLCQFDEVDGPRYLVVMIDMYSRYVELAVTRDKMGTSVMSAVEDSWLMRYGVRPEKVLTDKGTEFNWLAVLEPYGIEWSRISTGNPQAHGMVEKVNDTFINGIRKPDGPSLFFRAGGQTDPVPLQ